MTRLSFTGDGRLRTWATAGARWLVHAQLWQPRDPDALITGDHETAVLLLNGTFDLVGGSTAWQARGARTQPFTGRPMAVFLPPRTEFRTQNGAGSILMIAARQPAVPDAPQGREGLGQKPLLAMAGSGKAFDPNSGEWRPAETFPTAAESLPPRRFERIPVGACTIERVFAKDYKAASLSVDEVVVPAGQSLRLRDIPGRPRSAELLLYVLSDPDAAVAIDGQSHAAGVHAAFLVATPDGEADVTIHAAANAPCYAVLAYAGKGS
jgi:hypothetical protein